MAPSFGHNSTVSSSVARDRTQEFGSIILALQGRRFGDETHQPLLPTAKNAELSRQSADFMKIAKSIGRDIANTYTKLEKLTLLAKRQTIFDDKPQEIEELTRIIKEDMNALNRQIGQLQQIARSQQGQLSRTSRHQASHSSGVVVSLQSKLASMTSAFKQVLEVRTENLRESKSRQEKFTFGAITPTNLPIAVTNGYHKGSVLALSALEDDEASSAAKGDVAISMDQSLLMQRDMTDDFLYSRANAMQNIESTIVELGGIFQQLAHMIKEQEEVMVRIDANVEDAALNVEAGHAEILKYFKNVTSNRWLMVKIFGVLIIFFIFFIVFMA